MASYSPKLSVFTVLIDSRSYEKVKRKAFGTYITSIHILHDDVVVLFVFVLLDELNNVWVVQGQVDIRFHFKRLDIVSGQPLPICR